MESVSVPVRIVFFGGIYFSTTDSPVWISSFAATTAFGVIKLSVPSASRFPSLSNTPHAEPDGASPLIGSSLYVGALKLILAPTDIYAVMLSDVSTKAEKRNLR